jgi:uncharacterized protein YcaQ
VLEYLFGRGIVAASSRGAGGARLYDLAERVVGAGICARTVEENEARRQLLAQAARAHGVATAADLADYFRMSVGEARPRIHELVSAGEVLEVRVEGWREPAYLHAQAPAPRVVDAAALLSPFDPVVWFRPRTRRLFDFDYRFEIFIPADQRRWGCYVLPFLLGDRLVARVDLKADRGANVLRVMSVAFEDHANEAAGPLARELQAIRGWLGLGRVIVQGRTRAARALAGELRAQRP